MLTLIRDPKARLADIQKKKYLAPADLGVAKFVRCVFCILFFVFLVHSY